MQSTCFIKTDCLKASVDKNISLLWESFEVGRKKDANVFNATAGGAYSNHSAWQIK
jgi:hypothetical protein